MINTFKQFINEDMNYIIEYIAYITIEDLFSVALNGMEYGISQRKVIGANDGIFDENYVYGIIENKADDKDIFNDIGYNGFVYAFNNIKEICREYLELIENNPGGEVEFIEEERPDIYNNVINSLKSIIK